MKKRKIIRNKKEEGITLIALVITIVIIIILATVTINMAFGDGGLIRQAEIARDMTANSTVSEEEAMNSLIGEYSNVMAEDDKISLPLPTDGSYSEEKGVNTPNLGNNMELVIFDSTNNTWKEDITNSGYSYIDTSESGQENRSEWANAKVTVDGIDSYFVWIPRYAYKITYYTDASKTETSSTPTVYGTIDIKFIQGTGKLAADGVTECKYASENPDATQEYVIHPAFTTDEEYGGGWDNELAGIWIGKYEASLVNKSDESNIITDDIPTGNVLLSEAANTGKALVTKPGYSSWRYCAIGNMYTNALGYSTELKSHMLKNSEWGAVAYLTDSKYGRNGKEIKCNDQGFITGGGTGNSYATNNYLESTTGNVYGIYDLSGGAYEYVTGYVLGSSSLNYALSFADGSSDEYSTVYNGTNINSAYKYGDATYETAGWHEDHAIFSESDSFVILRGNYYLSETATTGIFAYNCNPRRCIS